MGGICDVRYPEVYSSSMSACLLAAVLCGSPAIVRPFPMSAAGGLLLWVLWIREKPENKS